MAAKKTAKKVYKDTLWHWGEALRNVATGEDVRFLRMEGNLAVVGNMVCGELPTRVDPSNLKRPSMLPDAQWLKDVQARG